MAICKSCGEEIIFIRTLKSFVPCDPVPRHFIPNKKGDTMIVTPYGEAMKATLVERSKAFGVGYVSHFASCPNAQAHRKKQDKAAGRQMRMEV